MYPNFYWNGESCKLPTPSISTFIKLKVCGKLGQGKTALVGWWIWVSKYGLDTCLSTSVSLSDKWCLPALNISMQSRYFVSTWAETKPEYWCCMVTFGTQRHYMSQKDIGVTISCLHSLKTNKCLPPTQCSFTPSKYERRNRACDLHRFNIITPVSVCPRHSAGIVAHLAGAAKFARTETYSHVYYWQF